MIRNRIRNVVLFFINHFFAGNYLWKFKAFMLSITGVKVGKNTRIAAPLHIDVCCNLAIGDNCWIGKNFSIMGNADVEIGDNCDIAPEVILETGTHEIGSQNRRAGKGYCNKIVIGNGCWIGIRATVLAGVEIGNASIVAAGAVVNKNISDNVVVGGVPAKKIKELC